MFSDQVLKALKEATQSEDIKLDIPSSLDHGDWATSVALSLSKRYKKPSIEVAKEIVTKLENNDELKKIISKIEIAGPGFINFWVSDEALIAEVIKALGEHYVTSEDYKGRKVVVEYSSPNIAKPFGIGHFRSTIIGDAIANLLEATGHTVFRDNHLGDWGTQFGKLIYAIKAWGNMEEIERSENPVKGLVDLYVKFHEEAEKDPSLEDKAREWFKKLENGDLEAKVLWQKCVDLSLKEFERVYKILEIKFTENDGLGYGESYFELMMAPVVEELKKKNLLKDGKEGAKIVEFPSDKLPPLMILKSDGATLYSTRDLATDKFRLEKYGKDVVILNEVGAEQSLYFQQLYELEKMLGWVEDGQRVHISHGLFRFKDRKMSTRKGNIVFLEDVITEAIKEAEKFGSNKELAETVAIGALKWNEVKRDPIKDIIFDWKEILSMDGNSGPYLQYTYARARSVLEKSNITSSSQLLEKIGGSNQFDEKEKEVARVLVHFSEIVKDAAINYSPHVLATYLFNLAQTYNSFYNSERIIGTEREEIRLLLTGATGQIIKNGLTLLGIKAPEKM